MKPRERIINALTMREVDKIPWDGEEMQSASDEFEAMKTRVPFTYGRDLHKGMPTKKGRYTDEWGCIWEIGEDGVIGEVKGWPLADYDNLDDFSAPWDVLEQADLSCVNECCRNTDKFCVNFWFPTACSPFQRMQFLRGTENLFMDLAMGDECPEVYRLRDLVHEFYVKQLEMWCQTDIDAIHIEDDWGAQKSLLISPQKWREFFKPLYKEYCDIAHAHGKYVIMHSDGYIIDIIEDLIEIGVNAINAQIFCMDLQELEDRFGGRICFWGEIDRQYALPFGSDEEIEALVDKVADTFLKNRKTGIVAMCPSGKDISPHAKEVVYRRWREISNRIFGK